ncbi:EH signature domain-containing protein [Yersinia rochesterensis]|uniref:EH signature domain-containing protein n=1 Tax=Yersinia TaxID=629 RepID=UPI00224070FA|nr:MULTISPECIES: EH signature domain-containing protein [Yersinia]MDA5546094.1 EH signature domain-containing protein [Yersinia rochesterensis]UZM75606.1 EH signature domain-containing protein [Yersinia sp. SCPM-O-B-9106 (C-191)]
MKLSDIFLKPVALFKPAIAVSKGLSAKIQAIHERWPDVVREIAEHDREKVLRKLLGYVESWQWDEVKMSFICSGAPIVFDKEFRTQDDFAALQEFYLRETIVTDSSSFISAMISAYIRSYEPGSAHTTKIKNCLDISSEHMSDKWKDVIDQLPEFFDANQAHQALAEKMVMMDSPWKELKQFGITHPHEPGLMSHAHLAYIALLRPELNEKATIKKLFAWLKPDGKSNALMSGASEAINALLSHWLYKQPDEGLSRFLTETLVAFYEDPRLSRGGVWGSVDEKCRNLIINWLTRENILFFLDVVSKVEDSHMWEPRREFWLGLYNQGKITAAWVAFSSIASQKAKEMKGSMRDSSTLNFGIQTALGNRDKTSLLILQIGKCIVIEGSHSYKVHIFRNDNKRSPELYQLQYNCEQIRMLPNPVAIPHFSGWQDKVREQIEYLS